MVARRALVTLPDGVWKVIDNELKGKIGDGDSEVIRNLVIAYLIEKGHLITTKEIKKQAISIEQIASELDIHDAMITSLVESLEEKGLVKGIELDKRIQRKLHG